MLSCLVPPRFGQEDKIMPSSTAFSLQFSSLASSLHHHNNNNNNNKDDDNLTAPHADYVIDCPQCHQRLPGFQALRDHLETEHQAEKQNFDNSGSYHQNNRFSSNNNNNTNNHNNNININSGTSGSSISNNCNLSNKINNTGSSNINSHSMIPGSTPSPPISTTPIVGGGGTSTSAGPADLTTNSHHSANNQHNHQHPHHQQHQQQQQQQQHHHHHHHQQQQQQQQQQQLQHHHQQQQQLQQQRHHQQQQHAMAMAIAAAGMTRTSPPTSASLNGYDEGGRSTSSPSSSTTLGDICGALGTSMMGPGGPHGCAQCSASFPKRELLEKHEIMHSPNTTVSCKVCHKTFANVYRLQRHMISHDESALLRKFKCTECDKAFKFKHHLKEHVRIHSGEKPFACDNCGKRFSHSGSYSSHMTSKKCISMGLKLNNNRSIMKSLEKAGGPLGLGSPNSKRGLVPNPLSYFPPGLHNVGLPGTLNNNNTSSSPNNNVFYPILPKYSNYDAMNAAFLATIQNPFYSMGLDPRIHPYSIHRLLELTAAGNNHNIDLLKNCSNIDNSSHKTPSLHSDPEDMIEEVTEDVNDEPKLVMDLDAGGASGSVGGVGIGVGGGSGDNLVDDDKTEQKYDIKSPLNSNTSYERFLENINSEHRALIENQQQKSDRFIKQEDDNLREDILVNDINDDDDQEQENEQEQEQQQQTTPDQQQQEQQQNSPDIKVEDNTDDEDDDDDDVEKHDTSSSIPLLQCSRCEKKFNHHTELVQHEKVLCGLLNQIKQNETTNDTNDLILQNSSYFQSGSEEDAEDRESKTGSECERKVRIRTAITEEQQIILKEHYAVNARPSRQEFQIIANRLGLESRVVQVWFQNNRSRERKLNTNFNIVQQHAKNNFTSPILSQSISPAYSPAACNHLNSSINNNNNNNNINSGNISGNTTATTSNEDQPLDLSLKKEMMNLSRSPRYGIAPLQSGGDGSGGIEAINLSRKSSRSPTPYRPLHYYNASIPGQYRSGESSASLIRHTTSPNEAVPRHQTNPYVIPGARGLVPMECLLQMTPEYARSHLLGIKIGERGTSLSPGSEKRSWRDDDSRISHDDEFSLMHAGKRLKLEHNGGNPDIECPFVCDQCDKAFSKQSSLARHKYEHSGQRPYKCEECPKAFKHKHHLTEHKRLHSGEKPFQCTKCLKRFSHSGSYSQHMNHRYSYCKPYRE